MWAARMFSLKMGDFGIKVVHRGTRSGQFMDKGGWLIASGALVELNLVCMLE